MEVSTARMSYDFKMSSDYNHGVLNLYESTNFKEF